jgi:hypothetical protein
MRRVGNRLQLALKRWRRDSKKVERFRARQRWASKFGEYDCVGGPLDGLQRKCLPYCVVMTIGGYYSVDHADCRLHFHAKAPVSSSWMDGL